MDRPCVFLQGGKTPSWLFSLFVCCDSWSVWLFFPIYAVFDLLLEVFVVALLCFLICCCHLHTRWVQLLTQKICLHLEHEGEQHRGHCCRFYIPLLHNRAVKCLSMKLAAQWYFRVVSVRAVPEISTDIMTSVSFFDIDLFDLCEICEDLCDVRWPNKFWCLSSHSDSEVQRYNRLIGVTCFVWEIREIDRCCLLKRDTPWAFLPRFDCTQYELFEGNDL